MMSPGLEPAEAGEAGLEGDLVGDLVGFDLGEAMFALGEAGLEDGMVMRVVMRYGVRLLRYAGSIEI